jgi:hypothetical protein
MLFVCSDHIIILSTTTTLLLLLQGKTNFFERRVGEYQKAGVMQSQQQSLEQPIYRQNQNEVTDQSLAKLRECKSDEKIACTNVESARGISSVDVVNKTVPGKLLGQNRARLILEADF